MIPTTSSRLWLVRPRPHEQYTRTLYPQITSGLIILTCMVYSQACTGPELVSNYPPLARRLNNLNMTARSVQTCNRWWFSRGKKIKLQLENQRIGPFFIKENSRWGRFGYFGGIFKYYMVQVKLVIPRVIPEQVDPLVDMVLWKSVWRR